MVILRVAILVISVGLFFVMYSFGTETTPLWFKIVVIGFAGLAISFLFISRHYMKKKEKAAMEQKELEDAKRVSSYTEEE